MAFPFKIFTKIFDFKRKGHFKDFLSNNGNDYFPLKGLSAVRKVNIQIQVKCSSPKSIARIA